MLRKLLSTVTCIFVLTAAGFAQVTIEGTVTDAQSGESLPGVNVLIQELQRGTATNSEGNFSISGVESGTYTLVATFIGYQRYTEQIQVSNEDIVRNISLQPDVVGLEDVVVTAQGIQREKRALGYSVSSVDNERLQNQGQSDVSRILKGKVPGVNITNTSGVSGTATDFVIRGYTTISGSNQPLFIVDGVRFNTDNNAGSNFFEGGALSTSSRFLDIDPNNIASVNVLKGLSATTIYGEQGRNGVVIIQTKSGTFDEDREAGFDVTIDQSIYANEIASMPDYQQKYGGGFHQNFGYFFSNWGPAFDSPQLENLPGFQGTNDQGYALFAHPYSQFADPDLRAAFPEFQGATYPYKPFPNSVSDFFRTGMVNNTSINISGGFEDLNVSLNIGRNNEEGFTPGNTLLKHNVGFGANYNVFEDLTVKTTFNYAQTDMETPPIASSYGSSADTRGGGSVFGDVFYTPINIDLMGLPYRNPVTDGSVYYRGGNDIQNPRWTWRNITNTDDVKRTYGKTEVIYDIMDWLNVSYKVGLDTYSESQGYLRNQGGVNNPDLSSGYMQTRTISNTIWDHNMYVNFDRDLTQELNLNGLVGGQLVVEKLQEDGIGSRNQIIFDLFEHGNFTSPSAQSYFGGDFQYESYQRTAGVFADLTLGYNDYVYLNLSGRNDWFSTLEPDNRSIFYPSASLSVIPTDIFDFGGDILSYLKLRAGVGNSAGAPSPYQTRSTLASDARGFVNRDGGVITSNAVSNRLGNRDLKAELHTEYEAGIEARFLEGRIGLDITGYTRTTTDLITDADLDPATGYRFTSVNVGEMENQGIEISLDGTPINGPFQWDIRGNFYTYSTEVLDLGQDLEEIAVAGFTDLGNFAIEGEPFLIMQGSRIARDDQGRRLVDDTGNWIEDGEIGIIGNPHPKYTLSGTNTFRYKGFSLTAQVDYQHGGDIYSTWVSTLLARGISSDTGFDRQVPLVLPGVRQSTGEPNDIQISATQAYFNNIGFGPEEVAVYDATHIRLSELSFSYNVPPSILSNTPFKQVSLTLSGFNLWYFATNIPEGANFDPNVSNTGADNGLGFEYLAGPSATRYGGSIRVQF